MLKKISLALVRPAHAGCAPDSYTETRCKRDGYNYRRTCTVGVDCVTVSCGPWYPTGTAC